MEQSAQHPEKQGDSPSSQPLEWFPEPPNEVDSEEDSSGHNGSEATEEDSCDESVSGESIYNSTEEEDFELCSEEVSDFPGDEKQGEVDSITKEKEDSLLTSDAAGGRDDTTPVSHVHEVHGTAPKGQESGWFPEPLNICNIDSEDSSGHNGLEAKKEHSCNESVSGESIYSSTEDEDFELCSEEVSGFPGDEKQGEVDSITKEKEDSLPTSDATGQRDDTTLINQVHEVCGTAPKGQESSAASEDQFHDTLPQEEDAPTGPVYVIVLVALIFQSLCVILLLVAMVIIALAGGFTGPPVVHAGPAIITVIPTTVPPAPQTNTRSLSPGICKPVENSLPNVLVAHTAQASLDTATPKPDIHFPLFPPLNIPSEYPPIAENITIALALSTYEFVHNISRIRINHVSHLSSFSPLQT